MYQPSRGTHHGVPRRVMFLYLGRHGAMCQFTLQLALSASSIPEISAAFVISSANALAPRFSQLGEDTLALETFGSVSPFTIARNFVIARRQIGARLKRDKPCVVINLMPHVWTPLLGYEIRRRGIPFVTVVHDAVGHPGDAASLPRLWLRAEARMANLIVTLSHCVAGQLADLGIAPAERIIPLFLPDIVYGGAARVRTRDPRTPLRLLFFGRILKYKGLSLLLDALELLRSEGINVHLGVAGAGDLSQERARLSALGATVINRWLDDCEVAALLASYDAVALSHIECSQSGVAATAYGGCIPVVGVPTGGIVEQIVDGWTGVLAERRSAESLAAAIRRLASDKTLYQRICSNLRATAEHRSMHRFVNTVLSEVVPRLKPPVEPSHGKPCPEISSQLMSGRGAL